MTSFPQKNKTSPPSSPALVEALEGMLRFGSDMLRAGNTAYRVRQFMGEISRALGVDALSVHVGLNTITASGRRNGETATLVSEVGTPGVNTARIQALEKLVRTNLPGITPQELTKRLETIENELPRYTIVQTSAAIGVSCGAFAFLNSGTLLDVIAAAVSGGVGQCVRSLLQRRRINQYVVSTACASTASILYFLIVTMLSRVGLGSANHTAGFISSVLFLVPGFPLVASLLDILHHQTLTAITRFAYAMMILFAATFGLFIVNALVDFNVTPPPPLELGIALMLVLRAIASFAGGCGFAILYNSSIPTVLAVGFLSLVGNELRLILYDAGMLLASATFIGSFMVGIIASIGFHRLNVPRIALTVPGIIVMVPGTYAFQMVVLFNKGHVLEALQAAGSLGFVIGAMAMGLAAAQFLSQREWIFES